MATARYLFIIGAPKAGTTSFASWLCHNDGFFQPEFKEPGFFRDHQDSYVLNAHGARTSTKINFDFDKYLALFESARGDQWAVDASTDYLSCENTPARLKEFAQGRTVKLLCMLRDPIDRAFSEYQHTRRDALENVSFRKSLEFEPQRIAEGWQPLFFHMRRSRYYDDIMRYRAAFGDDLMMLDNKALAAPEKTASELSQFLDVPVDPRLPPRLNKSNEFVAPGAQAITANPALRFIADRLAGPKLHEAARNAVNFAFRRKLKLSAGDRDYLYRQLKDDIDACLGDETIPTGSWSTVRSATSL